ncbi:MAG: hypothetical protein Fur0023_07600 [Bacteroidia bacterium]
MSKQLRILLILATMIGLSIGCRKYPQDPYVRFNFKHPMYKVVGYKSIVINGKDVTQEYSDSIGMDIKTISLRLGHYGHDDKPEELKHYIQGSATTDFEVQTDVKPRFYNPFKVIKKVEISPYASSGSRFLPLARLYGWKYVNWWREGYFWKILQETGEVVIARENEKGDKYIIYYRTH